MWRRFSLTLVLWSCAILSGGADGSYNFVNFSPGAASENILCMEQDKSGVIWLGGDKGLCRFDGYSLSAVASGPGSGFSISAMKLFSDRFFILGTDAGLYVFDLQLGCLVSDEPVPIGNVKALLVVSGKLFIGSSEGVYVYEDAMSFVSDIHARPPKRYDLDVDGLIYSLCMVNNYLYVGSEMRLFRLTLDNDGSLLACTTVNGLRGAHTLSLRGERMLVGNFSGIRSYDLGTGEVDDIETGFSKCFLAHGDRIYYGTDNGLFIIEGGRKRHFVHSSNRSGSVINNVIRCIFADRDGNVYFGTDYGLSVLPTKERYFHGISSLTEKDYGNNFSVLRRDEAGNYWFGGNNGLIVTPSLDSGNSTWFRMMSQRGNDLPHNRVRDIYVDNDGHTWICTDAGLARHDPDSGKLVPCRVSDGEDWIKSSWVYAISEDGSENMWLATYMSGVLVIPRPALVDSLRARAHYVVTEKDGLRDKFIDTMIYDSLRNRMLVLLHNGFIDGIDCGSKTVTAFSRERYSSLVIDASGDIWASGLGTVSRLDPDDGSVVATVEMAGVSDMDLLLDVENELWCFDSPDIYIIGKSGLDARKSFSAGRPVAGAFYDKDRQTVVAGSVDGYYELPYYPAGAEVAARSFVLGIEINGRPYPEIHGDIRLKHNENNVSLRLVKTPFFRDDVSLAYKSSLDDDWVMLDYEDNTVDMAPLRPGKFRIDLVCTNLGKEIPGSAGSLTFRVMNPWYLSLAARVSYGVFLVGILFWVIRYLAERHRLTLEKVAIEKTLQQARMKSKFFADMSHELKTPLSMIIAPSSRILSAGAVRDEDISEIKMIYGNALKINALLQSAISYTSADTVGEEYVIPSTLDFVDFARTVFSSFEDCMGGEREFVFTSNVESLVMEADAVKMESVLNNLVSNACRFTAYGDTIMMSMEYDLTGRVLELRVSDDGVGIPSADLPFIFQRFYQSPVNNDGKTGTGIGLSLVKKYVAMHDGTVEVRSVEGEGATFVVRIPVQKTESDPSASFRLNEMERAESPVLVEIVEDNESIAEYLCSVLGKDYRCVVARNGKTGLKLCLELQPHLVITDLLMPVMNGMEMCRRIRENSVTSTIPIIMLTAVDTKMAELESLETGVDEYVSKPFDMDLVLSKVKQLLGRRSAIEHRIRIERISEPKAVEAVSFDEKLLADMVRVIEENVSNSDLNVGFLCEELRIDEQQLRRKVKKLLNTTPVEYIKTVRLQKAALLLRQHEFNVSEVMYMVGFSNASYFTRAFSGRFGMTPNQYRQTESSS